VPFEYKAGAVFSRVVGDDLDAAFELFSRVAFRVADDLDCSAAAWRDTLRKRSGCAASAGFDFGDAELFGSPVFHGKDVLHVVSFEGGTEIEFRLRVENSRAFQLFGSRKGKGRAQHQKDQCQRLFKHDFTSVSYVAVVARDEGGEHE